jgi:Alpha/beta hydrolase domain
VHHRYVAGVVVVLIGLGSLVLPTAFPAAQAATAAASSPVPVPTVVGPITTGKGKIVVQTTSFDLASVGYEQAEYFISGTAHSYSSAAPLGNDGKWTVTPDATAPYETRIIVYRPIDPAKFDGTVNVEWLNVSGQVDAGPDWAASHVEQIREGMAWVGVTAQKLGIEGGSSPLIATQELKNADPVRYGPLDHPGDAFSYDIYSQAAQAVRKDSATVLGGLQPKRLIAVGQSQSAFYLTSYADALAKQTNLFDGFLIHSRAGHAAPFDGSDANTAPAASVRIRSDLHVPVLVLTTEPDLVYLGYHAARQPDSGSFRDWEVAGSSHYDTYGLGIGQQDTGDGRADVALFNTMINTVSSPYPGVVDCAKPINAGPMTYIVSAAVSALNRWVRTGTPPPRAPRLQFAPGSSKAFAVDANGIARGGIRTAEVDAPIATLSGLGQTGNSFCGIFGTTTPFTAAHLAAAYPTHAAFVKAWDAATDKAVKAGFVLLADAPAIKAAAAQSNIGG